MSRATFAFEPLPMRTDRRGWLVEPVDQDALRLQANAHLVLSQPGEIRGNHFHRRGAEIMVVVGTALVRARVDGALRDVTVPEGESYRFHIPPGVAHAVMGTGASPMILISFNTEAFDPADPDVERDVVL
jgi:UDP-2-acetamido-2,6-beta-L-arabino-hexul-4-ose reductase